MPTQGIRTLRPTRRCAPRSPSNAGRDAGDVWFSEHDVVGALLGREHGIVPRGQAAGAGDALGLEMGEGFDERGSAGEVSAIGPARATKSTCPSSKSAASLSCTGAAIALMRLINVRSSDSANRSRTAATSPASMAELSCKEKADASEIGGVVR